MEKSELYTCRPVIHTDLGKESNYSSYQVSMEITLYFKKEENLEIAPFL